MKIYSVFIEFVVKRDLNERESVAQKRDVRQTEREAGYEQVPRIATYRWSWSQFLFQPLLAIVSGTHRQEPTARFVASSYMEEVYPSILSVKITTRPPSRLRST